MVNPFIQTKAQQEKDVLEMIEGGYSYPQIMKECHVSPNTIADVKKKYLGVEAPNNSRQISKETLALKWFGEGKTLFQVAIELDIEADYVFTIYQKFQRLRNREGFISKYEQVKGNLRPFLDLFDLTNRLGMTLEQVAQLATCGLRLPYLWNFHSRLCTDIHIVEWQKRYMRFQLNNAYNQLDWYKTSLESCYRECEMKRNELLALNSEIDRRKKMIQNFDNDEGYNRIREQVKKESKLVMQDFRIMTTVTLCATFEAIKRYPDNQALVLDITSSQNNSQMQNQQLWKSHEPQMLELIENVQNEIAERITGAIVSNIDAVPQ